MRNAPRFSKMDASFIDIEADWAKGQNVSAVRQEVSWEGNYFLNWVITCDETWIHFFEPESKRQSSVWKHLSSPSPTKAIISKSTGKVMAIIFCDTYDVVLNHLFLRSDSHWALLCNILKTELKRPHLLRSEFILRQRAEPLKPRCHWYTRKTRRRNVTAPTLQPGPSNLCLLAVSNFKKTVFVVRNLSQGRNWGVSWSNSCGRCQVMG
jgi:hypothetical protein